MTSVESLRTELVTKLVSYMFQLLEKGEDASAGESSLVETEIHRQIAQALVNLTKTHATDISRQVNYSRYVEILNKQKVALDELFSESVQKILQQLSSC